MVLWSLKWLREDDVITIQEQLYGVGDPRTLTCAMISELLFAIDAEDRSTSP